MPVSKKRKKNGKKVGNGRAKNARQLESFGDRESGVTLQDLINVVAYQDYEAKGLLPSQQAELDPDNPDHQAIVKAVHGRNTKEQDA